MLFRVLKTAAPVLFLINGIVAFAAEQKEEVITLSTQDGWALSALYRPATDAKKTVVLIHDLNKNKEQFETLRADLGKEGFGSLAFDLRGHGQSTNKAEAFSFAREGVDNEYNKMTRDVDAALNFLKKKRISETDIIVLGAGLGANVASKSMSFWPDVSAVALISPTTNNRDVLAIPSMRLYKGVVLIAAGAADKKMFLEASVIRNVAFLSAGEGKVTFLTAYDLTSHEMLDKYLRPSLLQWFKISHKPEVLPDIPVSLDEVPAETGKQTNPLSATEDLSPSLFDF